MLLHRLLTRTLIISSAVTLPLLLTQCVVVPPPVPKSDAYASYRNRQDEWAYRRGYHRGFQDGKHAYPDNYERYYRDYGTRNEPAFAKGYGQGYTDGASHSVATLSSDEDYYELGYDAGQTDAANSLAPDPQRHRQSFGPATARPFKRGYTRGFTDFRKGITNLRDSSSEGSAASQPPGLAPLQRE